MENTGKDQQGPSISFPRLSDEDQQQQIVQQPQQPPQQQQQPQQPQQQPQQQQPVADDDDDQLNVNNLPLDGPDEVFISDSEEMAEDKSVIPLHFREKLAMTEMFG